MVSHLCLLEQHIQDEAVRGCVEEVITNSTNSGMAMLKLFSFAAIKKVGECGARVNEDRNLAEHLGNIEIVISPSNVVRQITLKPSRAILKAQGIIPRDPSPEPLHKPQPQSIADLPLSEIRRLAQERLDQLAKCKKEDEATVQREAEKDTVKREAEEDDNPRPRKVYKMDRNGTIDLTDS
ncbi:hypothetical protein CSHISOI_03620 [Colletotrichum shisoi]|uniref:Uncharacterized protein n=1 Tax=Colletotrichum shisoi TaxID=2078593 RepID=A0A5Q4C048_9PEZI|nr:hypothetical protein CSHISOI_03620 [Colletotrichum shisoi]